MAASEPSGGAGSQGSGAPTVADPEATTVTEAVADPGPMSTPADPDLLPAGGPLASRSAQLNAPATVGSAPGPVGSVTRFSAEPPVYTYARHAKSPLPYLVAAAVVGAVTTFVVRWAVQPVESAHSGGLSSSWWMRFETFIMQGEQHDPSFTDHTRLTWAALAMTLLVVALVIWTRRIGQNAKADNGYFGSVLAIAGLLGWWTLPLYIGHESPGYGESRFRLALVALLILVQGIFARWAFTHKIWRSGNLPLEPIAYVLWIPQMVAAFWYFGSTAFTEFAVGENGTHDSRWVPTESMVRLWQWSTRGTALAVAILLIVVTVIQHLGVAADRVAEREYKGLTA